MERLNFRIRRTNPDVYTSLPCSGGTNYWPINKSVDCSGMSMYNATGTQLMNALSGDIRTFPIELRDCSIADPCIILWDLNTSASSGHCKNIGNYAYKAFYGINVVDSLAVTVVTGDSYNNVITLFESLRVNFNRPINTTSEYNINYNIGPCNCDNTLDKYVNNLTLFLSQDFNDIGHYSIWDGNISQQEAFSNFVFTATTTATPGDTIKITNTTDFSYYKELQNLPFTIDWGDGGAGGGPTSLSYSTGIIEAQNQYPGGAPIQYRVTITQDTPWGPTSVSQIITAPNYTYNQLAAIGGIPANSALTINASGVTIGTGYTSGPSGVLGQGDYIAWDTGTDINEYSGLTQFPNCFEVTGITESILGVFQTYTSANSPYLPPGYTLGTIVPIGGDVINPISNNIETGMYGYITYADPTYTGYTISSANNATPINFYDFPNGITLYVAESCGLNALSFGAFDCFECTVEDCNFCETKDEYIDRISGIANSISFNTQQGVWSPYTDYQVGDIVFDTTYNTCCCFMAVKDIFQTGSTQSDWSGIPPSLTLQGVWYQNNIPMEHIWEACSSDCVNCPPGTATPCSDTTITHFNPQSSGPLVGAASPYQNGLVYPIGSFATGLEGNCYQALSATSGNYPPTAFTSTTYWEYVGCSTWICPQDLNNIPITSCQLTPGTGITTSTNVIQGYQYYGQCLDDFGDGECEPDRYWCPGQYGCSGCTEIMATNPIYLSYDPTNPNDGPVFNNIMDCNEWCNPPAYSCTTPTSANAAACCTLISCAEDDANATPGLYTTIVTDVLVLVPNIIPNGLTQNQWLALNEQFYFTPEYGIDACNAGTGITTSTGAIFSTSACCDYSGFVWQCCTGCEPTTVGGYSTLQECQSDPVNMGGGITPCGWSCETLNQPCVECYDCGCGAAGGNNWIPNTAPGYPGYGYSACTADCTVIEQCYVCDCTSLTPCTLQSPCAGPIDNVTWFSGSAQGNIDCQNLCACNAGWDCFLDDDPNSANYQGPTYCQDGVSGYFMVQQQLAFSNPAPGFTGYSSFSACCEATECCHALCDETEALGSMPGNFSLFPPGNWPCYWEPYYSPGAASFCDPTGANPLLPFCTMVECTSSLVLNSSGDYVCDSGTQPDDCICACDDYMVSIGQGGSLLTPYGTYTLSQNYQLHDLVSHVDADSPLCCYVCMCPSLMGMADCITTFDCSCFIPDDGPATNGTPNCWEACGATPGLSPTGCQPCGGGPSATYECTPTGCTPSSCVYNPLFTQQSQNCYTGNTCEEHCRAACYCENSTTDTTNCVVYQDYLNNTNSGIFFGGYPTFPPVPQGATHPIYPFISLDACVSSIPAIDCCPGGPSADTWYCDYSSNCEITPGTAGLGCVIIPPGTPGYPGPFTSLSACTEYCTWECGCPPTGLGNCVFNSLSVASVVYENAYDCWAAFSDCDCCAPAEEWWCDTYGAQNGDYSAAIPVSSCRNNTYYAGMGALYQQNAIGQLAGGPGNATNNYFDAIVTNSFIGVGFASQADCENYCRFCCDCAPPGTSHCNDVDWGVINCPCTLVPSEATPYLCELASSTSVVGFPCTVAQTEFYCLDIVGCQSFLSTSPPTSFISGPHITNLDCQAVCTWGCGDCIGECFCNGPQPAGTCNPLYYNLDDCINGVIALNLMSSYSGCCECYECFSLGSISYTYFDDVMNSWSIGSVAVSPFTGTAPAWVGGTNYSIGDVVTFTYDGDTCCYVCVDDDPANFWNISPYTYYTYYINDINTVNPVWPGPPGPGTNATNSGTLVWITCNSSCTTPITQLSWDCTPGSIIPAPGTCGDNNLTLIPGGPMGTFGAITWICDPANSVPPTTLWADFYHEGLTPYVGTSFSVCADPSSGNQLNISTYFNWHTCMGDSTFSANHMPFYVQSKQQFVDQLVTAGLAATNSMTFPQLRALLQPICGSGGQVSGGMYCICALTPCTCAQVVGPGGQFANQTLCNQTLASTPCCGFWKCSNQVGAQCQCVFDNTVSAYNPLIHYYDQTSCENDPTTCCSGTPQTNYTCRQSDCLCIPDALGLYTSLHDCQIDATKCCWTGVTPSNFSCVPNGFGGCKCLPDPVGVYSSIIDCESDPLDCCWTGVTQGSRWDCKVNGQLCQCTQLSSGIWGPYANLHECQTSHTCCYTGITHSKRYECEKTIQSSVVVVNGNAQTVYSKKCDCKPKAMGPYATLGDCLTDTTECCYTGITNNTCRDCIGVVGYAVIQNEFQGVWAPYNAQSSASGVQTNSAGGVTPWAPGLIWGFNEVTISPIDGCCYISVMDAGTIVDPTSFYDPSDCYQNFILGLACDGSLITSPTPVTTAQSNAGNYSVWWPCDETCGKPMSKQFECVDGACVTQQGGQYFSLLDCQADCMSGCEECSVSLASYMNLTPTHPASYLGAYDPSAGYGVNECVTDPTDHCCYCCVILDIVNWQVVGDPNAVRCPNGYQPSIHNGQLLSNTFGGWENCGYDEFGDLCYPPGECECCSVTLASQLNGPITWNNWPGNSGIFNYMFDDCVTNTADGCCYCCVNQSSQTPYAKIGTSTDKKSEIQSTSTIPCWIKNGNLFDNTGMWENCGCDQDGNQCPPVIANIPCYQCTNSGMATMLVSSLPCPPNWQVIQPICSFN